MSIEEDILEHFGVKGMRWGVRRSRAELDEPSPEAAKARSSREIVKKNRGSTDPLSNAELDQLIKRLQLEQQYRRLDEPNNAVFKREGKKFISDILKNAGKQQATALVGLGMAGAVKILIDQAKK